MTRTFATQGDWFTDRVLDEAWILARLADGREVYLATIVSSDAEGLFEANPETQLGNARLMAAAPRMLFELKNLLTACRHNEGSIDEEADQFDAEQSAQNFIDALEGVALEPVPEKDAPQRCQVTQKSVG